MSEASFDRASEDLGNLVELGHANFRVTNQLLATTFYVTGLGLTRDPFIMTGTNNMWVNVGNSQFHLPTGDAVVAPGITTGLIVPSLEDLLARLARVRKDLEETAFSFKENADGVFVTCPWGNRMQCHAPDEKRFGRVRLAMPYVTFEVATGRAAAIAGFYRDIMDARTRLERSGDTIAAHVSCGPRQELIFREMGEPAAPCPQHHIQIYLADFSGPYERLKAAGIPVAESSRFQYSARELRDLDTGAMIYPLDHEIRSMTHPMYGRVLINRDPSQSIGMYRAGHNLFDWRT